MVNGNGNTVTGAAVDGVHCITDANSHHREVGMFSEFGDDDILKLSAKSFHNVFQQLMSHGTEGGFFQQSSIDHLSFDLTDDNGEGSGALDFCQMNPVLIIQVAIHNTSEFHHDGHRRSPGTYRSLTSDREFGCFGCL